MNFRVGQKVVCVNAGYMSHNGDICSARDCLQEGRVYTVSGFGKSRLFKLPGLFLIEAPHPQGGPWYEARFRPIVDQSKGMETLRKYLEPKKGALTTVLSEEWR